MTAEFWIPFCWRPTRNSVWTRAMGLALWAWMAGFACIAAPPFTVVQRQVCAQEESQAVLSENRIQSVVYGRNQETIRRFFRSPSAQSSDFETGVPARAKPQYEVTRWTEADGLPADKIGALIQTRDGYLWVGSVGGLVRFDGVRFQSFHGSPTTDDASTNIVARAFHEDADGQLWVGTKGQVLRREVGGFVPVLRDSVQGDSRVNSFATRLDGGFWLATDSGIEFWDGSRLQRVETIDLQTPFCLEEDGRGALWIGSLGGLYRFNLRQRRVDQHWQRDLLHGRPDRDSRIFGLKFDPDGKLWLGASHGAYDDAGQFNLRTPASLRDLNQLAYVFPMNARLAAGRSNMMWVAPQNQGGQVYGYVLGDMAGLEGIHTIESEARDVRAVIEDREGAVWFGGRNGLFRARRRPCTSLTISQEKGPMTFRSVSVGEAGSIEIASESTIGGVWSGRNLEFFDTGSAWPSQGFAFGPGAPETLWTGLLSGGLLPMGHRTPTRLIYFCDFQRIATNVGRVFGFHVTRDRRFWALSDLGLFALVGSAAQRVGPAELVAPTCLDEDSEGRIWVGTAGGSLFRQQSASTAFHKVPLSHSLEPGGILSVLGHGEDTAWLGLKQGLAIYHRGRLRTPDPMGADVPRGPTDTLLRDHLGRLWLGHSRGISRVTLGSQPENQEWFAESHDWEVSHYGGREGLADTEPSTGWPRGGKTPDGRLWFARRTALVTVDPAELERREAAPLVLIEAVAGIPLVNGPKTSLTLPPGSGETVSFDFTSTSLFAPERGHLEFKLEGRDTNWRDAGFQRRATYHRLSPGKYRFSVRARNHEGRWCESESTLALHLLPRYWQTAGFQFCMTAGLAGGLLGGLQWFRRRQRREWESGRCAAVDAERIRIARDLHDQLGATLSETALMHGEPQRQSGERKEVLKELAEIIWAIHPENDTLPSFGDFIADYSCRYLGRAGLEVSLEIPLDLPASNLPAPLRSDLAAMFKEALRNVVRHAQATHVTIRLAVHEKSLALEVIDNGCGITSNPGMTQNSFGEASLFRRGHGLRNLDARCLHWKGECRVSGLPSGGTHVRIELPVETRSP